MIDAMPRYHEVRSPQSTPFWNPLHAAIRLSQGAPFRDFVLYEADGAWYYAGGTAAQLWVKPGEIIASWPGKRTRVGWSGNPLSEIPRVLAEYPGDRWNAYGWAAFELSYFLNGLPPVESELPLVRLVIPHTEAVIGASGAVTRSLDRHVAADCMDLLEARGAAPAPVAAPVPVRDGREQYLDAVRAAVADINAGRLEKVIISRRVPVGGPVDLAATYRLGREGNTPARSFLLRLDDMAAAGFSPETVLVASPGARVSTQPLAGTRALGLGPEADAALATELYTDPKEVYEHAISMRSSWLELSSVCAPGSVRVDEPMELRRRGTVQHLGSLVSGRLAEGRSALDAFGAVFPAVTASGIPKAAACACISRIERAPRGLYAGSVLRLGSDGTLDAALVLRSVFQSGGSAWLQAGAGIVGVSRPEREFEETCEKLASVARHVVPGAGAADPGLDLVGAATEPGPSRGPRQG
jgi:salicylate synthase